MNKPNNRQVGGTHYQGGSYQHWDWVADNFGRGYFQGQITRYVSRWRLMNGVEDLEKAIHYLDKLEELHKTGKLLYGRQCPVLQLTQLRGLSSTEQMIFVTVATYENLDQLDSARVLILDLLQKAKEEKEQEQQ